MNTEDEIRRTLHPEAYEPMPFNPRIPLGCDQQERYPEAADVGIDDDEIHEPQPPQRDPWWPQVLGAVCALVALALVFGGVLMRDHPGSSLRHGIWRCAECTRKETK